MRKYLLVLFLSFISFAVKAQVGEYRTDFAVGVNGGYVLSNVGFQPDVPQSMLGGMTMGVTLRYTCEKYFKSICAIVAEVNLVQTGWKEKIQGMENQPLYYEGSTEALHYQRKMTYLQIPLFARLGWGRERKGLQGFFQRVLSWASSSASRPPPTLLMAKSRQSSVHRVLSSRSQSLSRRSSTMVLPVVRVSSSPCRRWGISCWRVAIIMG